MALEEIRKIKIDKVKTLKDNGVEPYPASSGRTHRISQVLENFDHFSSSKEEIVLAGRVLARRGHGGLMFFDINDGSAKIQGCIKEDVVGKEKTENFRSIVDTGDFIEVSGFIFKTQREEKTIEAKDFRILTKALLPLPEKWEGLQDPEERFRKRYLDIAMNPEERELFFKKSSFWQTTRTFLLKEGGLEVETPVLEQVPGGADAEPFKTHMNALNMDLYLRISPELSLKKLNVAGYEKVFEIGRIFRNEGIDKEHLQDYTQIEMYWAYTDYEELMKIVKRLVRVVVKKTLGTLEHEYQGHVINWGKPWKKIDYYKIFKKHTGLDLNKMTEDKLKEYAVSQGIDAEKHLGRGRLIDVIFKKKVRPHLIEPGFLVLPPIDIEPLAKRWSKDPNRVERFQIVAGGSELGKGFSELNDPLDQRQRFEDQANLREKGDKEAQFMNEEFVEALEYGMPPTAGFAYSERLFAFIMNKPIRETVFFPLMKPRE